MARIEITFDVDTDQYVVGDEDGEFARATTWPAVLPYVECLLAGPGTVNSGGLKARAEFASASTHLSERE